MGRASGARAPYGGLRLALCVAMLRLVTFNAGLAVGVLPRVSERLPYVLSALSRLDADIMFVQEFWLDSHWDQLRVKLQSALAHTIRPAPEPSRTGRCTAQQLDGLRRCASQYCAGLRDEALAQCMVKHCATLALSLPVGCLNCIVRHPTGNLEEILQRCVDGDPAGDGQPEPEPTRQAGGLIAYGGSFGTGLLMRFAPLAKDTISFPATLNARGALWAHLHVPALGEIHLFAAHLSPGGREQDQQLDRLIAWMQEKSGTAPAILLGDLNTTPNSGLFRRLERVGFRGPPASNRFSTFSSEGLLTGYFGDSGWQLDHVLVRGERLALETERILESRVLLQTSSGPTPSTLSDHAAVLARVRLDAADALA